MDCGSRGSLAPFRPGPIAVITVQRSSFAQAAVGDGAAALNRVFHEYLVPITFSSEQLHLHMCYNDVAPWLSPIWYDERGRVVAAALLAIRGKRGWIGGFGVAPEHRGRGCASALLDTIVETARAHHVESISLEVLCENRPAIAAYQRHGFQVERTLHSFEYIAESRPVAGFCSCPPRDLIDEPDAVRPCWQRERATLRNGAVSSAVVGNRGQFGLFRFNDQLAQVLKIAADSPSELTNVGEAVASGREFQSVLLLNEPQESPLVGYARAAGWNEPFLQYEMRLSL